MKGVLAVKGTNKRLVFQGVHMLFDAKFDREWKDRREPHQHPRLHRQKAEPHRPDRGLQGVSGVSVSRPSNTQAGSLR
jgi:G3E family GTPase